MSNPPASLTRAVRRGLLIGWWIAAFFTLAAWIMPVAVVENWGVAQRSNADKFSQFEAGAAFAGTLWFIRCAVSACLIVLFTAWLRQRKSAPWISQVLVEFWAAVVPVGETGKWRVLATRTFILAWMVLATYHAGSSVVRRLWDWPLFGFYSGQEILPNISDNNRDVIRYLAESTPPDARILVLSDQKLFFLSYYLLPRRLYHPMHPDAEFVIPQPYNQRQLAAYRLSELSPERIQKLRPDYILEYFEGEPYTKGVDLRQDSNWVNFKRRRNPNWRPQYLVSLRRYSDKGTP